MRNNYFLILSTAIVLASCSHHPMEVDVSGIEVSFKTARLDSELTKMALPFTEANIGTLRKKYGSFFNLYCRQVIRLRFDNDSSLAAELSKFISDPDVKAIAASTDAVFKVVDDIRDGVHDFFQHYRYYFPKKRMPGNLCTFFSAFNYNIITTDNTLGIGLDMYLGQDCKFYPSLGLPEYMIRKFRREYIVSDCIKGWFQSEYETDSVKQDFLNQMIYQGKQLYFTDAMAPEIPDTIKTGFSAAQLKWCKENESTVWAFFIENKLLFSSSQQAYIKYLNDGNTTNGFPKESPAKTGCFIGWQIVKQYMKKHQDASLEKLMAENDGQKILNDSGYKPGK